MAKGKGAETATIGVDYGTSTTQVSFLPAPGYPDLFRVGQGAGYEAYSIRSLIAVNPKTQEVRIGADAAIAPRPWAVLPSLKRCLRCSRDKGKATGVCTNPRNESLCLGLGRYRIGRREWSTADLVEAFMSEVTKRTPLVSPVKELRFSVPPLYAGTEIGVVRQAMDRAYKPAAVADPLFEPTSALVTVSQDKQLPNGVHIVVDIGGGTTDVATLEVLDEHFDIHEPRSVMIAGDDFDEAVFWHYRALVPPGDANDYELREACRLAKEQLSDHTETQVLRRYSLTRPEFDEIIRNVATRLVDFVAQYANERLQEFNRVRPVRALHFHLVGGASRIRLIAGLLGAQGFSGARPRRVGGVGHLGCPP